MELTAVIEGLKALKTECEVHIITDSKYVVDAFNKGWIDNWQRNGWRTSDKKPVKNQELWGELLLLIKRFPSTFEWVKGHDVNEYNIRCDKLAQSQAQSLK
jgi:ribonuclease HI